MITIKHEDGMIVVYSDYNKKLVEIFRGLSNRRWSPERKAWIVGLTDLYEFFIPAIEEHGFEYQFDDSFKKIINHKDEIINDFKLKYPLYPFQKVGANKLYNTSFYALFDDMGLGKTVQTIAAINKLRGKGEANRVLIICPNSLKQQWLDEIKKFSNLNAITIQGSRKRREGLWEKKVGIKIINYELVRFDQYPFEHKWDIVVLDEATRIKNLRTKTTQYVKRLQTARRFVLTGTPIENMVTDIFSIMEFLNPLILSSYRQFKERYLRTELRTIGTHTFEQITGYKNLDELKEKISKYYIRRTKDEVLKELPDIVTERIWIELNHKERILYNQLRTLVEEKIERLKIDESDPSLNFLGELILLRVLCNGEVCLKWSNTKNEIIKKLQPTLKYSSSKNDECVNLIESILKQDKDKVIVFSEFTVPLDDLKKRLEQKEIGTCMLTGEVKDREGQIEKFKKDEKVRVMLAQIRTGGYGLNLDIANQVIFLNNPWNPAVREQALSRSHRLGQKKTVFIYDLIVKDSIEERVLKTLDKKVKISQAVIVKDVKKFI